MLAAPSTDGEWVLSLRDYAQVEDVLAQLRQSGCDIASMELSQPDLEEVFVSVMRRD